MRTIACVECGREVETETYHSGHCLKCSRAYAREWYKKNSERLQAKARQRRKNDPGYKEAANKRYRDKYATDVEFRNRRSKTFKQWWAVNGEQARERGRRQRAEKRLTDPETIKLKARLQNEKWRDSGRGREWSKKRYHANEGTKLQTRISVAVRTSMKINKAGRKWESIVGYTLDQLIRRLKKTIPPGYTWQDYIEGRLELDHKIPISAFNMESMTDIKKCWVRENLQLLPKSENRAKGARLARPFQPSLL